MNYFIGFGKFDTHWRLADMPPEEGDIVFLIECGNIDPVFIGLFTVGELGEADTPMVEPAIMCCVPCVPVARHLLPEPSREYQGTKAESSVLVPVPDYVGHELLKIANQHVKDFPFTKRRKKREKAAKPPDQQVRDFERRAKTRIGQGDFRDELMRLYDHRCAITECALVEVLSAAHILDYNLSNCQEVWNGILLRADIHLLFDRHLLRIFPGRPPIVVLAPYIQQVELYKHFHLRPMRPPKPFDDRTNEELRRRWDAANRTFLHFPDPQSCNG